MLYGSVTRKVRRWWAVLVIAALPFCAYAPGATAAPGDSHPWFTLAEDSSEPVIEYTLVHHLLRAGDPEPLLRIYADGRVRVHLPTYMKRAGDYELHLSPEQLNELVRALARDGIMDFDPAMTRQQVASLRQQQREATGILRDISDATDTHIRVRLAAYRRKPASPRIDNLDKRFSWRNLEHDAKRYPQSTALQQADAGARRLHGFLDHADLRKLP